MATAANMSREVDLLAGSLIAYAAARGWKDEDYHIYYRIIPDVYKVRFLFVSPHFDDQDLYEATREVWAGMKLELGDDAEVLNFLGLIVRGQKLIDEGGIYAISPNYREYRPIFHRRSL